jgi:ribose transport system ATP-binding protein
VVVASSDAKELEGLCDRVIVMSRGQVVDELVGPEITEDASSTRPCVSTRTSVDNEPAKPSASSRLKRFLKGDYAPRRSSSSPSSRSVPTSCRSTALLNPFNTTSLMVAVAALGFISMGRRWR